MKKLTMILMIAVAASSVAFGQTKMPKSPDKSNDKMRKKRKQMNEDQLTDFAKKYTAAWCSQKAASVAAFYEENGSLKINDGTASVGRAEITAAAQSFMTAFPDLVVKMSAVSFNGSQAIYRWTLTGTNNGPGGMGKSVNISGYEEWRFGADGLIAESKGHFDENEYQRQLNSEK